jgi:hypothetical protein
VFRYSKILHLLCKDPQKATKHLKKMTLDVKKSNSSNETPIVMTVGVENYGLRISEFLQRISEFLLRVSKM